MDTGESGDGKDKKEEEEDVDLSLLEFSRTTTYHWPNFAESVGDGAENSEKKRGPLQFGTAFQLQPNKCLSQSDFRKEGDACTLNIRDCEKGISASIFIKINPKDDSEPKNILKLKDSDYKEYLMSTGGDNGSPGFAIYKRGDNIGAIVSTGDKYWEVEVKGAIPLINEWTNIGIVWEPNQFNDQTEYLDKVMNWDNLGGLRLFKNLKLIGKNLLPKPCHHNSDCPNALSNFFDPTQIMIGCHATKNNPEFRNHPTSLISYDEAAIWTYPIDTKNNLEILWGGYTPDTNSASDNVRLHLLKKIDPSDTNQVEDAIKLLSSIANSGNSKDPVPFANIDETIKITTTSASTQKITRSTTMMSTSTESSGNYTGTNTTIPKKPPKRKSNKLLNTLYQLDRLTDSKVLPKYISSKDLDIRLGIATTSMDVLGEKGVFESSWKALYNNNSESGSHLRRENLEGYLIKLLELSPVLEIPRIKRQSDIYSYTMDLENVISFKMASFKEISQRNGNRYFGKLIPHTLKFKSSSNGGMQLIKVQNAILEKKGVSEGGYFVFPHWSMRFWQNINQTWKSDFPLDDRVEIPTKIFGVDCLKLGLFSNIVSAIYNNFADGGRRNPSAFPSRKILIMSRIVSVKVSVTNEDLTEPAKPCGPSNQFLIRTPLIIHLRHKVDFVPRVYRTRTLKFHSYIKESGIKNIHCAIWNTELGLYGGWDNVGISKLEDEDGMTTCKSHKFGTFAIIGELHDVPTVPKRMEWLQITKFVCHGVSIFCLLLFIFTVVKSSQLWDMLFFLSLSLAIALVGSHITMIFSEINKIRDDRHLCTLLGMLISFFYLSGSFILLSLCYSLFNAVVYGITSGRAHVYLSFSWGTAFFTLGLNTLLHFGQMGSDPRCMISWMPKPKLYFFVPLLLSLYISVILVWIVACNIITPAIRNEVHLGQMISLLLGLLIFTLYFAFTWTLAPFVYDIPFLAIENLNLNPSFQICNSLLGFIFFICLGIFSKKFRKSLRGHKWRYKSRKTTSDSNTTLVTDIGKESDDEETKPKILG